MWYLPVPIKRKMNKRTQQVLTEIAEALNSSGILWGVGASVLLYQYRMVENTSDIDIIVSLEDVADADAILSRMGEKQPPKEAGIYATDRFDEYIIDGVNVDLMAGFKIKLPGKEVFEYPFDEHSVPHHFKINKTIIPFSTLEDWYVLYQLIPGKEEKVKKIADYFGTHSIHYPYLMERMIHNRTLPHHIKLQLQKFLTP